jgi:hypothetical protein
MPDCLTDSVLNNQGIASVFTGHCKDVKNLVVRHYAKDEESTSLVCRTKSLVPACLRVRHQCLGKSPHLKL